jgi:hypothetical protein
VIQATVKSSIRSTNGRRARVLVLYNSWFLYAETTREHVEMFAAFSEHDVTCADLSILDLGLDLNSFEAIVFHYSVVIPAWHSDFKDKRRADIINARAIKMLFIQDEFRWVTSVTDAITELGISVVFSVQPEDTIKAAYQTHPYWKVPILQDVRFEQTLTGFVDEKLTKRKVPDYEARPLDVTYRARKLPFWVGRAGLEKYTIADRFLSDAAKYKLNCDIATSEESRIYGDAWFDFTVSAKATLGTEGSSGLIDFDGTLIPAVDAYCKENPQASFEEVEAACFPGKDGLIKFRAISPRCFEAAALRTLMILYKGEYSGVLEAGRHYVELKRDHSNMKEITKILRSPKEAKGYIERAYDEIACSGQWTSRAFMQKFDLVVSEELAKNRARGALPMREPFPGYERMVTQHFSGTQTGNTSNGAGVISGSDLALQLTAMLPAQTAALSAVASQLSQLFQVQGAMLSQLPEQTNALTRVMQNMAYYKPEVAIDVASPQVFDSPASFLTATAYEAPPIIMAEASVQDVILTPALESDAVAETAANVEAAPEASAILTAVEVPQESAPVAETQYTDIVVFEGNHEMVEETPKIPWTTGRIVRGVSRRIFPVSVAQRIDARNSHWAGQWDRIKRSYQIFMVPPEKRKPLA